MDEQKLAEQLFKDWQAGIKKMNESDGATFSVWKGYCYGMAEALSRIGYSIERNQLEKR
jgi:hypothetical protein